MVEWSVIRFVAAVGLMLFAESALASPQTEISAYRKAHGLSPVTVDSKLTALAIKQASAMATSGVMDHAAYASFQSRIGPYGANSAAENIAMGTETFASTFALWKSSPGHNANLLMSGARRIGIASASGHGRTFWALILASPKETSKVQPLTHHLCVLGLCLP
jgi:uncharacterized protein YkwD